MENKTYRMRVSEHVNKAREADRSYKIQKTEYFFNKEELFSLLNSDFYLFTLSEDTKVVVNFNATNEDKLILKKFNINFKTRVIELKFQCGLKASNTFFEIMYPRRDETKGLVAQFNIIN